MCQLEGPVRGARHAPSVPAHLADGQAPAVGLATGAKPAGSLARAPERPVHAAILLERGRRRRTLLRRDLRPVGWVPRAAARPWLRRRGRPDGRFAGRLPIAVRPRLDEDVAATIDRSVEPSARSSRETIPRLSRHRRETGCAQHDDGALHTSYPGRRLHQPLTMRPRRTRPNRSKRVESSAPRPDSQGPPIAAHRHSGASTPTDSVFRIGTLGTAAGDAAAPAW